MFIPVYTVIKSTSFPMVRTSWRYQWHRSWTSCKGFHPFFVKEHSDSKSKYFEDNIIKMLEFLVDTICVVYAGKGFQKIVGIPMGTNYAPLLADIWNRIYTLNPKETVDISVRFHPDDDRWCLVHKQSIVWELHGPYVSCWPWDKRHDREQHFCFLPGLTSREGRST